MTASTNTALSGANPLHVPVEHQQPHWPDPDELADVVRTLGSLPALVSPSDCDELRRRLAAVARGEAFLLQGGDCAELFAGPLIEPTRDKLRCLADMAAVLASGSGLPSLTVGRLAGQYAKPRSMGTETRGDRVLPVYRGDAVNDLRFDAEARTPNPQRLLAAYRAADRVLSDIRRLRTRSHALFTDLGGDFFTSHEALLLPYETALTRSDPASGRKYGLSGHLLWIGERTRQLNGPHMAFVASVHNPVAVKIGPTATRTDIAELIELIDPHREPGRLTFITRLGAHAVHDMLPPLVDEVVTRGSPATWVCDPVHGNTFTAADGIKTRQFEAIWAEVRGFIEVHRALGTHPGGLHLELTSRNVTECMDNHTPVHERDLHLRYETACDPRLNGGQALELARLAAPLLRPGAQSVDLLQDAATLG
ncbi:3-deoxy-7-phosphoheptulonate synthase [Streptomyces botrytidirepellens]|uniref:Phospho-2-dehydro-3-deoxyheptonate aldolase n=1 Tax=Streptomyces botrytidirepellens TaxID=2486417 RepID=A0A3M8SFJ4_9ACTN|nr:3-deoxy-7-phosphoheptulonate synthase [Streptomyces botrytidirepellens]RNF77722.1 3-deoxy-7-phosphoheptulonate synthase class II [Streptomyces botrytidirepellens]